MSKYKTPDGTKLVKPSLESMYIEDGKIFMLTSYQAQRDLDGVSCFLVKKEDSSWENYIEEVKNFIEEAEKLDSEKKLDKKDSIGFIYDDENGKVDLNDSKEVIEEEYDDECLPLILDCPNEDCKTRIYDISKGIPFGFSIPLIIECPMCGEVALDFRTDEEKEEDDD
jgi:hypothetical protein